MPPSFDADQIKLFPEKKRVYEQGPDYMLVMAEVRLRRDLFLIDRLELSKLMNMSDY